MNAKYGCRSRTTDGSGLHKTTAIWMISHSELVAQPLAIEARRPQVGSNIVPAVNATIV